MGCTDVYTVIFICITPTSWCLSLTIGLWGRLFHVDGSIEFCKIDTPKHDFSMFGPALDGFIVFNTTIQPILDNFGNPHFKNPSFLKLFWNSDNRGQNLH